ncbi:lectin-like protein [Bythopirellula goksoeyrii]|uniref:Lectin C-type domain protein n=1 Tax=Bythopirellula goksoeyrii TaxID=1400387 RepID=A0A5B9QAQ2_9BACT|nr:lectin-like protein [Bythopirellula goksoeyrii]QEG35958.1 Lectin C-type domain protein [Bythopirellula goksoeyrii]
MDTRLLFCFAVLTGVQHGEVRAEHVRWEIADGGNGHWYEVFQGPTDSYFNGVQRVINWPEAQLNAQAQGGYLATVTSSEENEFVFSLTDSPSNWQTDGIGNYFGAWLGAFQEPETQDPTAGWQWITGEPFAFANWHPGEPNDLFGQIDENRIAFFASESSTGQRSAFWNDEQATRLIVTAYVVEYVPEPTSLAVALASLFACSQFRLSVMNQIGERGIK